MKSYCLVITEGTTDKALIDVLMDKKLFLYSSKELLLGEPRHCRQIIRDPEILSAIAKLPPETKLSIVQVGDSLTDCVFLPPEIKSKISMPIQDFHSRPELEILLILHEGLYSDFQKVKSKVTPKEFAKSHLRRMEGPYDCSYAWVYSYFSKMSKDELYRTLQRYEENRGKRKSQEKSLFSLLKPR